MGFLRREQNLKVHVCSSVVRCACVCGCMCYGQARCMLEMFLGKCCSYVPSKTSHPFVVCVLYSEEFFLCASFYYMYKSLPRWPGVVYSWESFMRACFAQHPRKFNESCEVYLLIEWYFSRFP